MDVFSILPTPLGVSQCPFHKDVKSLILKEIELRSQSPYTSQNGENLYHFDYYSLLQQDRFKQFKSWIQEQGKTIVMDVMGHHLQDTMVVTDSWVNVCHKNGLQKTHNHNNSFISAVYYVNYTDQHVPTYFVKNELMIPVLGSVTNTSNMSIPFEKETIYNQVEEVKTNEGDLVLFPSNILHGYKTNCSDERITVAMNMMPNVLSGWDYGWSVQPLTDEQKLETTSKKSNGDIWLYPDILKTNARN